MSEFLTFPLGVVAASLVSRFSEAPFSSLKLVILGFAFFLPLQFIWAFILYPTYFSPLRRITSAPRVPGLAGFIKQRSSEEILEWIDTIPNDGFIRHLETLNTEVIVLTEPKMIADFLGAKAYHFNKAPRVRRILEMLLGRGLVTVEGKVHKLQRKLIIPTFHVRVIRGIYPFFWTKASEMTSLIKQEIVEKVNNSGTSPVKLDIEDWAGRVSLDIIGQAGFGSDFSALKNPNTSLNTAYRGAFVPDETSKLFFLLALLTGPKFVSYLPFKKNKQIKDGVTAVTSFIKSLLDRRQSRMHLNGDDLDHTKKANHGDVVSVLMQSGAFTTPELIDQAKTLLGAGHETSAGALTFAIHLLSQPRHAHIQKKLREEIRTSLPSPVTGISIDGDIIDRLPYLEAVSREAMRIYAPIPSIGRIAIIDTDICGTRIPKGTSVRVHPWAINKAKHLWGDDAREFKPERWLEGNNPANGGAETLAYLTFGHGPRGCIGRGFAAAENKILLATLIGSFEFKAVPGSLEAPDIVFGVTARIIGGPQVTASIIEGW